MTVLVILLLLLLMSLYMRVNHKQRTAAESIPDNAKPSPVSEALKELIGTAGGIYLSLVLLVSFLQIDVPDTWLIIGMEMDPLAFISIGLVAIQPLIIAIYEKLKGVA
jgi:hypothetical protein